MDPFNDPCNVVTFTSWLLALIVDANATLFPAVEDNAVEVDVADAMVVDAMDPPILDTLSLLSNTLHNYRICFPNQFFSDEVEYWVKPRSTTWFSRFLLEQYDNRRWLSMFRMTKTSVFALAELLKPQIEKKNTKYRLAVLVVVRVACTLFKLTHGANLTIYSEMFAIGRSTVCKILRDVVHDINNTLRHEISWPQGDRIRETQAKFATLCSLPAVVEAIDRMHVSISKPRVDAPDYFYFKSGGYTINCQAVVDSDKRFLDLYVGMPGSTNDSRMLCRSTLHSLASSGSLFDPIFSVDGHTPFLIGDSGYPLLPWLMVPHRGGRQHSIFELLFNKKLQRGRCLVENAFGILKQTFRELLGKSDLDLNFLPDVIICCALLHNVLLRQSHEEVEELISLLHSERAVGGFVAEGDNNAAAKEGDDVVGDVEADFQEDMQQNEEDDGNDDVQSDVATVKRIELGIFLTTLRRAV